jgi:SAM-dependent methyltransferase
MSWDDWRTWLRQSWGLALDVSDAREHETYDPARPLGDVAARLGLREERDPERGLTSDQATLFMGAALARRAEALRGRTVWEVGCGTGVLSALAARLGAARVRATDVDARAVELARRTAALNGVTVEAAVADLFEGAPWADPADVLVADLPQKPVDGAPLPLGQDGGPEGLRCLGPFLEGAPARLAPGGRLFFFVHSLAHPGALVRLHALFRPRVLSFMRRIFEREAFAPILPYLESRRARGLCRYWDRPDGRGEFLAAVFEAERRA